MKHSTKCAKPSKEAGHDFQFKTLNPQGLPQSLLMTHLWLLGMICLSHSNLETPVHDSYFHSLTDIINH